MRILLIHDKSKWFKMDDTETQKNDRDHMMLSFFLLTLYVTVVRPNLYTSSSKNMDFNSFSFLGSKMILKHKIDRDHMMLMAEFFPVDIVCGSSQSLWPIHQYGKLRSTHSKRPNINSDATQKKLP